MQRADFHFDLPQELIARYPSEVRSDCRLLCVDGDSGQFSHHHFPDLVDMLEPGDLLVFNDTRVIPARLHGHKASGGKVEMLLERPLDAHRGLVHLRASKSPSPGTELNFEGGIQAVVEGRQDALFELRFLGETPMIALLEQHGHMPLPPYITRDDELSDRERYQTVYARRDGAVPPRPPDCTSTNRCSNAWPPKGRIDVRDSACRCRNLSAGTCRGHSRASHAQ